MPFCPEMLLRTGIFSYITSQLSKTGHGHRLSDTDYLIFELSQYYYLSYIQEYILCSHLLSLLFGTVPRPLSFLTWMILKAQLF